MGQKANKNKSRIKHLSGTRLRGYKRGTILGGLDALGSCNSPFSLAVPTGFEPVSPP